MPEGDPWPAVRSLLDAEASIRNDDSLDTDKLNELDPYWADLIRLLQVFRCLKNKDANKIKELRRRMSCDVYNSFIDRKCISRHERTVK